MDEPTPKPKYRPGGNPDFINNQFKPGNPGGPGKPKLSPQERRLISLTKQEVARLLNDVSDMTLAEMKVKFDNPDTKAIEKLFIKTIIDGLRGDAVKAAEFILTRTVGKPKENLDLRLIRHEVKRLDGSVSVFTNEDE